MSARFAGLVLRMNRRESIERVQQRLLAAGMSTVAPSSFLATKGLFAAIGGAFGLMIWISSGKTIGLAILLSFAVLGWLAPGFLVGARARRRRDRVQAALPDALDLLAVSVEAGMGFDGAIAKLTGHMHGDLIDEVSLAPTEMPGGQARPE